MSNCPFCNLDPPSKLNVRKQPGLLRSAWRSVQWLFPTTLLILMPKCPLCVMGYVALFTGVGIAVSTARWIQILMLIFCLSALAYLAVRYWRSRFRTSASNASLSP